MALNDSNRLNIAFKKLVGKAHTQQGFSASEESLPSNVSLSFQTIFGEQIDPIPRTNGLTSLGNTDNVVELLRFELDIISDTLIGTNQSQGYALKLPSGYSGVLSATYSGGTYLHEGLGRLQIVPAGFGSIDGAGASEYDPVLYQSNGSTEITKFDAIDWTLDTYNGILFVQDPTAGLDVSSARPSFLEAFLYVGNYLDDSLTSGVTNLTVSNVGTGEQIFVTGGTPLNVDFRTISVSGGGLSISTVGDDIILESTGAQVNYSGNTPSNIEVGGLPTGTTLTGRTVVNILEEILYQVYEPTFVAPSNMFNDDQDNTQEIGSTISDINFTATFDRGQILLQGVEQDKRSGLPNTYLYTGFGLPSGVSSTSLSDIQTVTGYTVTAGTNTWSSSVVYDAGVQPLDSEGAAFGSPLASGTTISANVNIEGIYPWFYGTFSAFASGSGYDRPVPSAQTGATLISGGTKVVEDADGTLTANFNSTVGDYIWFATPATDTTKTVWFDNIFNNGAISGSDGGSNLFPAPTTVSFNSPSGFWSGVSYKLYVSNYQTAIDTLELRNS